MQVVVTGKQASSRRAISSLIKTRLGLNVIGEAGDYKELMDLVKANKLELVLLDDDLPGMELGKLVPTLRGLDYSPAVIVLNEMPETEEAALAAGANAFVYKGDHPKQLLIAIEKIRISHEEQRNT
jgi:DNA-binding NarL/FixJ family response regulator